MIRFLKNYLWHLPQAAYWNYRYQYPSRKLTLIGVTGTDGKTTTCTLVQKILENAGIKCGIISTISSSGLHTTSPDPKEIQKVFTDYYQRGYTHVVCEVTSHSLDQFRYWGTHFKFSILTNIAHEHLDYHKSMDNYIKTKAKLFSQSDLAILNHDDPHFTQINSLINIPKVTYGVNKKSTYTAKNIRLDQHQMSFEINQQKYHTDSNYRYQIYNILAAFALTQEMKLNHHVLSDTIKNFPVAIGRREEIENNLKIRTIVDFAHTPQALEQTLSSLRETTKGRLLVIFGATGGRDKSKRPLMGKVVSDLADIAFITSDDTRNEDVNDINQQIISGIDLKKNPHFKFFNIPNRQDAFNQAVSLAKSGDTIIACGKGHETTILLGNTEYPWSEPEAFRSAFRQKEQNV